jgi:glycosyltransferase involved in cell wall biosynthesis
MKQRCVIKSGDIKQKDMVQHDTMNIAVLMAALNEEQVLPVLLKKIPPEMDVFIVDDGSTDRTATVARAHGAAVIQSPLNLGQGHAFITGLKGILRFWDRKTGCIVFLDADGQHDPDQIPVFVKKMQETGADIVVGSRILGENYQTAPVLRKFFLPYVTGMINRLSGYRMTDAMCGFRAFRLEALSDNETVLDAMIEPQYLAAEMFLRFGKAGLTVAEVPIVMEERKSGASYKGMMRYGFGILRAVARVFVDKSYWKI